MSDTVTEAIRIPPKPGSLRSVARRAASWWVEHLQIDEESDVIEDDLDDDTDDSEASGEDADEIPPRIVFRREWTTAIYTRLVLEEDGNVWLITSNHPLLLRIARDSGVLNARWPQIIAMEVSYRDSEALIRVHDDGRWREYYSTQVDRLDS